MLLGKKQYLSLVDNHLGRKLGLPLNSLGSKLTGGVKRHLQFSNQINREKLSPLEKH